MPERMQDSENDFLQSIYEQNLHSLDILGSSPFTKSNYVESSPLQPTNIRINTLGGNFSDDVMVKDPLTGSIMSRGMMTKLKALHDLESNMERVESIITQKDSIIDGLRRQLDKALICLEKGGRLAVQADELPAGSSSKDKSRESRYQEKFQLLNEKYQSVKKSIKSYESAIDKLSNKREDERRERKAKDQIVEQYLQQMKIDHELEVRVLNEQIAVGGLTNQVRVVSEANSALPSPRPTEINLPSKEVKILGDKNAELKRKLTDTEQQIRTLEQNLKQKN